MRLLFLGIDGLGLGWFERLWRPALPQTLAWGELRAPVAMTGPSWTSIWTGLPVEQHGVVSDLGQARPGSKSFVDLPGQYLWEVLPGPAGAFNLPATFPPRGRPGSWMVSGYPFRPAAWPRGLLDGLDYVGDYASLVMDLQRHEDSGEPFWPREHDYRTAVALLDLVERMHLRALRVLPAVEHLFACTTYFDRIGHCRHGCAQPAADPFDEAAGYCLRWAQALLALFPAEITVMCSDHGWDDRIPGHDAHGFWCMWGPGVGPGRRDLTNHELRAVVEGTLAGSDPEVLRRLQALGYVEG